MVQINFTLLKKRITPLYQLAVAIIIGWAGMLVCRFVHHEPAAEYFAAMVAIIFYVIMNTIVSLAYTSFLRYTMPSFYIYILLVAVLFFTAKQLSGISIWTLSIYKMMLVSVSIFYFMVGVMVRVIRVIYEAAESGF
ncbi:MAG: hypothetical protein NTY88_07360 [Bacteroidetes bacterium]|nr:hypothetical protein [Bacteroidota bacterium]